GFATGGNVSASVFDEGFPDQITIILFDDGTGPGDTPNDGEYTGNFTIRFDGGVSGTWTNDTLDILDLADGGLATVVVDIDGLGDSGFTQVQGDFSIPQVTINSVTETVDTSYTLNATITDMNMDTGNVSYRVDGRPNQPFYYAGGNDYQSVVNTSGLLDGPHTIRIMAYDLAGNLNNTEAVTIDVLHPQPPAPDLSVSITVSPPDPKAGDTVTITATIENTGDADASDVTVTFYVGTEPVYDTTETIPAGETRIVEGNWKAREGDHGARVEVSGSGITPVFSPIHTFEVQPAGDLLDIFKNPWVILVLIVIIAAIMIGGTVGWAYLGKEMAKAKPSEVVPVTPVTVPPEGKDPCEEIRRKWKAIVAEYERSLAEMESTQRRAWNLREVADEARSDADRARREADDANEEVAEAKVDIERAKRQMHDFFAKSLYVDGISVGTPKKGEPNHIGYFKGLVKVFFRGESSGEILSRFVKDNREAYDELQDDYDDLQRGTVQLESQAAAANQMAAQAEAEATAAENRASAAEQELDNLKNEVRNLKEKSEAFREKWRVCNLERLREAAEEAERAAAEAEEGARNAQNADSASELEEHKKEAEDAKEKVEDAKGEAEKIKKKLQEEGVDEGLEEYDDIIRRASRSAASAVQGAAGAGSLFRPDPSNLGKPCRGGETRVLNEYTMQYQFYDPTREIT
ncbi:MAG: CARDB domain-containing protein, partial [bacterium]